MFHYTVKTDLSIEKATEKLQGNLKEEQFGVLWQFDIKDKLQEKGLDFDTEYLVLEVCNPKEAERVLNKNLLVGYFLPCKIVLYKDENQTKIGLPKPSAMISMVDDSELEEIAKDIEDRLIQCIDKTVA